MGLILINCDLGENESDGLTAQLLDFVDAASICCGVHAGSDAKTRRTLEIASEKGVLVGAHPGLGADGGRGLELPDAKRFRDIVASQLLRFIDLADACETWVSYVKLHGSLYHAVEKREDYSEVYLELLQSIGSGFEVISTAGGRFQAKAKAAGLKVYQEVFADRAYRSDGSLVPRDADGAVLGPGETIERFMFWLEEGLIQTVDGVPVSIHADTICVHSDSIDPFSTLQGIKALIG